MPEPPFTAAEFHAVVQKHVTNAVYETLAGGKLDWDLIAPFLETARAICRSEFRERAQIRLHTVRAEGDGWVDAEEAYLGIRVADRDSDEEWLAETYWLSEIALADADPAQVRRVAAALGRSLAKLEAWLAEQEKEGPATE